MSKPYLYKPLDEGQIRLLTVSIDEGEPYGVTLSLRQVLLDDVKGKYEALSYTWGRPEPLDHDPTYQPHKIWELKCDGGAIKVRQNLFDFLQQIRRMGSDLSWLWIDAVCIDQNNDTEKSEQVLRMGKIYLSSLRVLIWLGGRPLSIEVQKIIHEFIPAMLEDFASRNRDPYSYRGIDILDEKSSSGIIHKIGYEKWAIWKRSWHQYRVLFARTWFNRGWTVQEGALQAPEHCVLLAGSCTVPWKTVMDFAELYEKSRWPVLLFKGNRNTGGFGPTITRMRACRDFCAENSRAAETSIDAITLTQQWHAGCLRLVLDMQWMDVQDPRDKIYAYLGIMLQNKPACVENSIVPDYTIDYVSVYRNFATVMLQNIPGLGILRRGRGRRDPKLPSWVPDFSNSRACLLPHNVHIVSKIQRNSMHIPEISGNYLTLFGARFTSVSSHLLLDCPFSDPQDRLAAVSLHPGYDVCSGQCMPESIWRAVFENLWTVWDEELSLRPRIRQWLLQRIRDLWHQDWVKGSLSMLLAAVANDEDRMEWLPTLEEVEKPDAPSRDDRFEEIVSSALEGSAVYYMANGHFGTGPSSLCSGDQVWFFSGDNLPFVLRQIKDGKTHTLLGHMHIHGMMDGEAMTDEFRSRFEPVTIV